MKKIIVNNDIANVRTLSPFAYRDQIKTLEKSNEARVEIDGIRVFRSCVTSGRDVKNAARTLKYHLYFYATEADAKLASYAGREFMPITAEEFREYRDNPASIIDIKTVASLEAAAASIEAASEPAAEAPAKRKAKREKVAA
jgi:hypothetical protein